MLAVLAIACGLSAWDALYPSNTWLQVGPVAFALPLAGWALLRWPLSNLAVGCVTTFLLLHLFAAHWTYSFVPYNRWLIDAFGFDLDRAMGFSRNMVDRVIHGSFGLLMVCPLAEIGRRHLRVGPALAVIGAVQFVWAISALYEVFEWALTMSLSPQDAGTYNGEQGDRFDAQKDMALACLGAVLAAVPVLMGRQRR
ncbi:DUF2238 domain-containing protein [Novosphingobium colocasiae]|uniref:DUF2238 domain-containing protein n=1 Tax=Novosphingobium colocasiae TaxID=1256513 RepID=UPI0035B424A2